VDIFRLVWSQAPWLLIVAGTIFAIYEFREQSRENEDKVREVVRKAEEQYQQSLVDTRKALLEVYGQMGTVNKQQIENVQGLLTTQDAVARKLTDQRAQLDELVNQTRKLESQVEKARRDEVEAEHRKQAIEAELSSLERKLAQQAAGVAKREQDLARLTSDVLSKNKNLTERAAAIESLRANLSKLVDAVLSPNSPDSSADLAKQIRAQVLQNPRDVLAAYAATVTGETTTPINDLVGLQTETLADILKDGVGYDYWVYLRGPNDSDQQFFVGGRNAQNAYSKVVIFTAKDGRIVDAIGYDKVVAMRMPDDHDWSREEAYLVPLPDGKGDEFSVEIGQTDWSLIQSIMTDKRNLALQIAEPLFGAEKRVSLLSVEDFRGQYPQIYDHWMSQGFPDRSPRVNIEMAVRASEFDAAAARGVSGLAPSQLRDTLTHLLKASVAHDDADAAKYLSSRIDPKIIGRIAAAVLQPGFQVDSVRLINREMPQAAATASSPNSDLGEPIGTGAVITGSIPIWGVEDGSTRRVELRFERLEDGAEWRLLGFEST
jgi:23S rRNA maturation-related 3'-5' exoribonuclease YhaM